MNFFHESFHFSRLRKQEVQLSLGKADRTAYVRSPASE